MRKLLRKWTRTRKNKVLLGTVIAAGVAYAAAYRLLDTGLLAAGVWLLSGLYLAGFTYANRR